MAEDRVLQVGGLVGDAARETREKIAKARELLGSFKLPPLHKSRSIITELEERVTATEKGLTKETEPIKRQVDLATARSFLSSSGSKVDECEAQAKTLTEKAAVLQGEPTDEDIAAIDKEANEFAKELEKLRTEVQQKVSSLKPGPATTELRSGLGKLRNRVVAAEGRTRKVVNEAKEAPVKKKIKESTKTILDKVEEAGAKAEAVEVKHK